MELHALPSADVDGKDESKSSSALDDEADLSSDPAPHLAQGDAAPDSGVRKIEAIQQV